MPRYALSVALQLLIVARLPGQTIEWRTPAQPSVQIGELEGDPAYLFERITDAVRLMDGRIVIATGAELRYYDANGRHMLTRGGRGSGPGEFYRIAQLLQLPGDTVLVWDGARRIRAWFDAGGRFVRQQTVGVTGAFDTNWAIEETWALSNGNLLIRQIERHRQPPPIGRLVRPPSRFVVYDPAQRTLVVLGSYGGLAQIRTRDGYQVQPFTPRAQKAISSDRIFLGDGEKPVIDEYLLDGRKLRSISLTATATPVTKAQLDDSYTQRREQTLPRHRAAFERSWAQVPKPIHHPLYNSLVPLSGGGVYVSGHSPAVFPRDGSQPMLVLDTPLQVLRLDPGYVLGIWRDDHRVEYLRLFPITSHRTR